MSLTRVVAITGCDSGLGWVLAARSAREGHVTVAGMFNGTHTKAAEALKELCAHPYHLDVTKPESVALFRDFVKELLHKNPDYRLYAVVNNAGVMTIGDFEWQTAEMIENTVSVNLLGTMRVISMFLPDLRRSALNSDIKPRIINIASHCGLEPLPGFGPYSASKAAVLSVTRSLRYEQKPYGLSAVAFIPGGFVGASNITFNHTKNTKVMLEHLDDEQKSLYGKRIKSLAEYLKPITHEASFDSLTDEKIIETFMKALNDKSPSELYKVESLRYKFYYNVLKLPMPEYLRHWIIKTFVRFPEN